MNREKPEEEVLRYIISTRYNIECWTKLKKLKSGERHVFIRNAVTQAMSKDDRFC